MVASKTPERAPRKAAVKKPTKPTGRKPKQQGAGPRHALKFFASRWILIPLGIVAVLAVAWITYYQPMRIWYTQAREERVLTAQLEAIQRYNDSLRDEIASLETTAGVEEYARRSLNLAYAEDNTVIILQDGVPLTEERGSRDQELARLNEAPEPFGAWTGFLDRLFLEQ